MRLLLAISALSLAVVSMAQKETITLPWANGDTVVVSLATDADGDTITQTLSTVNGQAAATTPAKKPAAGAGNANDPDNANGPPTTTGPRVVGVDSTAAPMRTTTYWYDPGSGVWTSQIWTASITAAPTVATVIVPEGTVQNYNSYQTQINSVVFKSAEAAAISASGVISGNIGAASRRISPVGEVAGIAAWTTVVVGMIGAGFAVLGL